MKPIRLAIVAVAFAVLAPAVLAHHSAAMFDENRVLELKGVVKELQWANPHIWLQVIVEEQGKQTEWSIEGGSPNSLSRRGWRATTFTPGDRITVRIAPMKDGTPGGNFIGAKWDADGRTIGTWE